MGIIHPEQPSSVLNIKLTSASGNGFADTVKVTGGTTLGELFDEYTKGQDAAAYQITVNRTEESRSYVLKEGDRVTIFPAKIAGA